jgi:plastocyanin
MRSRLIILPFAAILSGACGGGSDSTGPGTGGGGGGGGGGTTTPVATTSVEMSGSQFNPKAIRVAPAATVTWTNSDVGTLHNVTFAAGSNVPATEDFSSGSKSLVMPSAAGTYTYSCTRHAGMNGSVVVQ